MKPSSPSSVCPVHRSAEGGLSIIAWGTPNAARKLAHLGFVQVADRVEGAGRVAIEGGITEQDFGFIARAYRQPIESHRLVVKNDHTLREP